MAVFRKGPLRGPFFVGPSFPRLGVALLCILAGLWSAAARSAPAGEYDVIFDNGGGEQVAIGTLTLRALGEEGGYDLSLSDDVFDDYFLSMRPFRCMQRDTSMLCHLVYPYENRRRIDRDDLVDLEYDLLFIARSPEEYGINAWNGRYFRLRWEGEAIIGDLHETNLDVLAAPPDSGDLRPLADADMIPVSAGQWAPRLYIKPRE